MLSFFYCQYSITIVLREKVFNFSMFNCLGKSSVENAAAAMLFATLKDYKVEEPLRLMRLNQTRLVRSAVKKKGFDPKGSISVKNLCQPINFLFTKRIDRSLYSDLMSGLKKLNFYNLPYSVSDSDVLTAITTSTEGMNKS